MSDFFFFFLSLDSLADMSFEVLPYSLISLWQMQSYQSKMKGWELKKKKKKIHVLHKNGLSF